MPEPDQPTCPECGRPMQLRVARRGKKAGSSFWGCTGFPGCRGTRECSPDTEFEYGTATSSSGLTLDLSDLPRDVSAKPLDRGGQVVFYQASAVPAAVVRALHMKEVPRKVIRAFSHWRLDLPVGGPHLPIPTETRSILSIAETILTRGAVPFCSPRLEEALNAAFPDASCDNTGANHLQEITFQASPGPQLPEFESPEEERFYGRIRRYCLGHGLGWAITAQIGLASLAPNLDPRAEQRGDFLFTRGHDRSLLVEIDGEHHQSHLQRDAARDVALEQAGVSVVRIPAFEVRDWRGSNLNRLFDLLEGVSIDDAADGSLTSLLRWSRLLHQTQLSLLSAIKSGWLSLNDPWTLGFQLPANIPDQPSRDSMLVTAVEELAQLLMRVASVHGRDLTGPPSIELKSSFREDPALPFEISLGDRTRGAVGTAVAVSLTVSDVPFPFELAAAPLASPAMDSHGPDEESGRWFLWYLFRKEDFWEGQWETVRRTLEGKDSIVLLPTGAGKSIAFQMAALLRPGRSIVVDPIISLIDDQIDNLNAAGIDRCVGITGQLSQEQKGWALRGFQSGHYIFCYVAPERFQIVGFRDSLRALTTDVPISVVVIDEAHCVSEWGHDFRTAYLNLGRTAREYCESEGHVPPLVALTGTASRIVLKDVQRALGITNFDALITPKSFDRPELQFRVLRCRSSEKRARLEGFLNALPTEFGMGRNAFFFPDGEATRAGLIFCPHVNGEFGVQEYSEALRRGLGVEVLAYAGSVPRGQNEVMWGLTKRAVASAFKKNRVSVLACTKAFGMGIDKPNVRYTVHTGLPQSIEAFYQEAGRAGRDRRSAHCAVILSNDNPRRSQRLLSPDLPVEEIGRIEETIPWEDKDDVLRALFFHAKSFRGIDSDLQDVMEVSAALGEMEVQHLERISWGGLLSGARREDAKTRAERALHRLVILGAVKDYTVDHSGGEFTVQVSGNPKETLARALGDYGRAYQARLGEELEREALSFVSLSYAEYLRGLSKLLIEFVYKHVELARRRALNEMLQAVAGARTGEDVRRRVLDYLQETEWDERLEAVRQSAGAGLELLSSVLDDVVSPADAAELRGAAARSLSSYPDVPGLLLLRGAAEALCADRDESVVDENVLAAYRYGEDTYGLSSSKLTEAFAETVTRIHERGADGRSIVRRVMASALADRHMARGFAAQLPPALAADAVGWLRARLARRCAELTGGHRSIA